MDLGAQATARAADRPIFRLLFFAPAAFRYSKSGFIGHRLEDAPTDTIDAPSTE
jgi:hypothetical protein